MRSLTVLVIGANGFIGSHLVARLAEEGMTIRVAARHYERAKHLALLPGVDLRLANVHDDHALRSQLDGCDAAINLVGVLHGGRGRPYGEGFRRAHVELPHRIAAACADAGVPRYLHMSALGANADGPSMYQRSKADGEAAARSRRQVAATIVRPSVVFGPGDHFLTMFAAMQRYLPVIPLACAGARFQPVHVCDVATAFVRALAQPDTRAAVIELGGPRVYTLAELVRLAGRYAGCERTVVGLPDWLARLQAMLFELLPGDPLISRDNLDSMKVDNVVDPTTKALTADALGIKLTSLEAAVPQYLSPVDRLDTFRARAGR